MSKYTDAMFLFTFERTVCDIETAGEMQVTLVKTRIGKAPVAKTYYLKDSSLLKEAQKK